MEKTTRERTVKEKTEKLRYPRNNMVQADRRRKKEREEELFSGCDKISVTWSICGRQGERNFSWRLTGALDKVRIGTLGLRGKMFIRLVSEASTQGK